MNGDSGVAGIAQRRPVMKIIMSALIALSVLSSLAAPASALDGRQFWDQYDRHHSIGG